jgi:hypothetical protein
LVTWSANKAAHEDFESRLTVPAATIDFGAESVAARLPEFTPRSPSTIVAR